MEIRKKIPNKMDKKDKKNLLKKNAIIFYEDSKDNECGRFFCKRLRACFAARRKKQRSGSLYIAWSCYKRTCSKRLDKSRVAVC